MEQFACDCNFKIKHNALYIRHGKESTHYHKYKERYEKEVLTLRYTYLSKKLTVCWEQTSNM